MFGMIMLNHMKMTGNNIVVKLKLFDEKIEEIEKLRFSIYDGLELLKGIEIQDLKGEDDYSSPFVIFDDLEKEKKYRLTVDYCINDSWNFCCECHASALTFNFRNGMTVYSAKLLSEDEQYLPVSGLKLDEEIKKTIVDVICKEVK